LTDPSDDVPSWLLGRAIVGFEAPFVDCGHNSLLTFADLMIEEGASLPLAVLNAIVTLKSALDDDEDSTNAFHRAFGMINESEVEASSLPPVLFVIEPDPPMITDSSIGNDALYVCYDCDREGEAPVFSVHGRGF
jgi:hypothetical protein